MSVRHCEMRSRRANSLRRDRHVSHLNSAQFFRGIYIIIEMMTKQESLGVVWVVHHWRAVGVSGVNAKCLHLFQIL